MEQVLVVLVMVFGKDRRAARALSPVQPCALPCCYYYTVEMKMSCLQVTVPECIFEILVPGVFPSGASLYFHFISLQFGEKYCIFYSKEMD